MNSFYLKMDWSKCSRCKKNVAKVKLCGYYYTETLCDDCIHHHDMVKCKCGAILGYVCKGSTNGPINIPQIYCPICAIVE